MPYFDVEGFTTTPDIMVKNARFFGQTLNISYLETPIKDLRGARQTLGKVSYPEFRDSLFLFFFVLGRCVRRRRSFFLMC